MPRTKLLKRWCAALDTLVVYPILIAAIATAGYGQTTSSTPPYVPGVTFQSFNPNYPQPNPFYFEGKIDWEKLGIAQPANAWEYLQRGIHYQDDLSNITAAISDYQQSLLLNSLTGGTCQIVTATTFVNGSLPSVLNPPPCMFTNRLRLAYLLRQSDPATAISLYKEVTQIDPLRGEVNQMIGETFLIQAKQTQDPATKAAVYNNAISAFKVELALSPVTPQYTSLTGDQANLAHVHWSLAEVYESLGQKTSEISELQSYLQASQWHSDVYPWRITLAQRKIASLQAELRPERKKARK
jgi:tetratricopeptide (TPR) repeat protein